MPGPYWPDTGHAHTTFTAWLLTLVVVAIVTLRSSKIAMGEVGGRTGMILSSEPKDHHRLGVMEANDQTWGGRREWRVFISFAKARAEPQGPGHIEAFVSPQLYFDSYVDLVRNCTNRL